jgi:hypothetical protein
MLGIGISGIVMQIINIIIIGIVLTFLVIIVFSLLECVGGSGGMFHHTSLIDSMHGVQALAA